MFFEEFPEHDNWISAVTMTEDEYRTFKEIKYSKFSLGITKETLADIKDSRYKSGTATCELIPENLASPVGTVPNLARGICFAKVKLEYTVYYVLYWAAKIP